MIHVNGDVWSAAGLCVQPAQPLDPLRSERWSLLMAQVKAGGRGVAVLTPELARSLRDWLTYRIGESPAPAKPDEVRLAVDEQRRALRERSAEDVSEDFRAGLAWGENALRQVAAATEGKRTA